MTRGFINRLTSLFALNRNGSSRRSRRSRAFSAESMEPRLLLTANLNLTAAGNLIFGGSGVDNVTTINYSGGIYTISDSEGFNLLGGMVGKDLMIDADPNTVEFDPTTLGVFNRIQVNGNAGNDSLTINGFRPGAEGLTVVNSAGTDSFTLNANLGSMASKLQQTVSVAAEDIDLNGSIWTADMGVLFTGPVDLISDVVVNTGLGGLTFSSTVNGASKLTTHSQSTKFNGVVGGATPLTGLTVTYTGAGSNITTGAVTANGTVLIESDSFVPSGNLSGSGDITIRPISPGGVYILKRGTGLLRWLQPGFNSVTIGSATTESIRIDKDANNNPVTGALTMGSPLFLIANLITVNEHINQEANSLNLTTNSLTLAQSGSAKGTGDVNINKLTPGGTFNVLGNYGSGTGNVWGLNNIAINAPGATVVMDSPLGSATNRFSVTAGTFSHAYTTAINVNGAVDLTVNNLTLGAGIFSAAGSVTINGNVTLASNVLFKVAPTFDLVINGDITGNGRNLGIVGSGGGPIDTVDLNGSATGLGALSITPGGGGAADEVYLRNVTATSIVVNGKEIYLAGGTVWATAGNLQLIGNVELGGPPTLVTLKGSGLVGSSVSVQGTIDGLIGNESLWINAGLGNVVLGGVVGGGTSLVDLTVLSGGNDFINNNITVSNDFKWTIGAETTVNGDNLTLKAGTTVTAGNNIDINVADSFFGDQNSLFAILGTRTVNQGGNP